MTNLEKYIKTIINVGVGLKQGQKLAISCPVDCAYFAHLAMEEAYKAGAVDVIIRWNDDKGSRINYLFAPENSIGVEVEWQKSLVKHVVEENYQLLAVSASDPEIFNGINPELIVKHQKMMAKTNKPISDRLSTNVVQWSIAAIPTAAWAKKVFANAESEAQAIETMWDAIFKASRIDDNDPVENWKKHVDTLQKKVQVLMDYNFKSIHFKNGIGTDLVIELPKGHVWMACGEKAATGNVFIANMPTEEVFTAPLRTGVHGIVYATKPLVYMGNLIEDFWIKFKDGKVIDFAAKKNQDILEKLITTQENADYLGEVALVPHSSPISQSGILWYNTLYDENASCHLALGRAYSFTVSGTEGKTEAELIEMGVNQSLTHSDFMMGSADMDIIGTTHDGKQVQVFKAGEWAI